MSGIKLFEPVRKKRKAEFNKMIGRCANEN